MTLGGRDPECGLLGRADPRYDYWRGVGNGVCGTGDITLLTLGDDRLPFLGFGVDGANSSSSC